MNLVINTCDCYSLKFYLFLCGSRNVLASARFLLVPRVEHAHHFNRLCAVPGGIRVRLCGVRPQRGRNPRVRVQVVVHDAELAAGKNEVKVRNSVK